MIRPSVLVACAALLCGCATQRPATMAPGATASALEKRSLEDPQMRAFVATMAPGLSPEGPWDLDSLTFAAVYFHPDLDIAYAKLEAAQAGVVTARQLPNPTLDLTPQFNTTTSTPSPWTIASAINLLVETAGKRGYRIEQAQASVDAARSDVETAAWQVRGRVRTALVDLWAADQRRDLTTARLEDESHLVTLLEHRLAIGEASALDLGRERSNRDQMAVAVRDAETAIGAARADLATALGIPVKALDGERIDLDGLQRPGLSPPRLADLRARALTTRSDVRAALAAYAAADAALRQQLARRYPNVTLGASYTYDQGDNKYGLSLAAIELPILNQNQGPIAEAAARRKEAAATFLSVQTKVIGAVDSAAAASAGAGASLSAAGAFEVQQTKRQGRVAETFKAGQIDRPSLLVGQLELDAARLARLDAAAADLRALGQMEDALQQPVLSKGFAFATGRPPARPELDPAR